MATDGTAGPRIRHLDDADWIEVKAQRHGVERVSIWEKWLEFSPRCLSLYARYDPNVVVERHGHKSDHLVFVIEGEITVGGEHCAAGSHIFLDEGAVFGPIVAGPEGAHLFEVMMGDPRAVPADKPEFRALCAERGVEALPNPPIDPALLPEWFGERTD